MKSVTDEALIIGLMDYRESDKIVTFFTRDHGRLSGVARGAKRSVKRFGGTLELFSRLSLSFTPADGLVTVNDVDPITIFPSIRATLEGIAHAGYACELVAAMAPERQANQRLFRLLTAYLEQLDNAPPSPSDRHFFEINFLNIIGYRPPLESCCRCGNPLGPEGGSWSDGQEGGVSCLRCGRSGARLGGEVIAELLRSLTTGRFGQISFPSRELAEAEAYLEAFISANVQRPLKSRAFLRLSP
ncbi:MAG TPA: DNA repair protein RecO [Geobacteraceae bacterium]|nr:DNA repair protein RecO [Geobacteraceae bacterium]